MPLEQGAETTVRVADPPRDLDNAQLGFRQQSPGVLKSLPNDILVQGLPRRPFEERCEVVSADARSLGDVIEGQIPREVTPDEMSHQPEFLWCQPV